MYKTITIIQKLDRLLEHLKWECLSPILIILSQTSQKAINKKDPAINSMNIILTSPVNHY